MLQIKWWKDGFYILEDERVRQFLIPGEKEALLIDTGFADSHVLEAARQVTDLPLNVVLTHGDPDHAGGLADFASCCLQEYLRKELAGLEGGFCLAVVCCKFDGLFYFSDGHVGILNRYIVLCNLQVQFRYDVFAVVYEFYGIRP